MSDQLDVRIRDLYAELVEAAPTVPPLPDPSTVRSPWVARWPALAAAATAAIVVLAAVPLLLGGEFFGGADESAETTLVTAAETTTTVAAETAPETTTAPATTVPLGPAEAVSASCSRVFLAIDEAFIASLPFLDGVTNEGDLLAVMAVEVEALANDVETSGLSVPPGADPVGDLRTAASVFAQAAAAWTEQDGLPADLDQRTEMAIADLSPVGSTLADAGASRCAGLGNVLPSHAEQVTGSEAVGAALERYRAIWDESGLTTYRLYLQMSNDIPPSPCDLDITIDRGSVDGVTSPTCFLDNAQDFLEATPLTVEEMFDFIVTHRGEVFVVFNEARGYPVEVGVGPVFWFSVIQPEAP